MRYRHCGLGGFGLGAFTAVCLAALSAAPLAAELLFYEPFDYAPGSLVEDTATWTRNGNGIYNLVVGDGPLAVPEGVFLKAPAGRHATTNVTGQPGGGWTAMPRLRADLGQALSGGRVYISMLVYHQNDGTPGAATGYQGLDLSVADGRPAQRSVWMGKASASNTRHRLEVVSNGGNVGGGADQATYEQWTAATRFVVYVLDMKGTPNDPTDDTLSVYINPDCRQGEPATPDSQVALNTAWWWQNATTQFPGPVEVRYLFLEAGANINSDTQVAMGHIAWDEIRVGTTWESVTPAAPDNRVATPAFAPDPAVEYFVTVDVSIGSATDGAEIWYTTDGADPVQGAPAHLYTGPIALTPGETTVKARAFKNPLEPSDIALAIYTVAPVAPPAFDPPGTTFATQATVSITCATPEAAIYYSTNGASPTPGDTLHTGPITLTETTTLKARAFVGELASEVTTATYTKINALDVLPASAVRFHGRLGERLDNTIPYLIAQHDRTHTNPTANFDMLKPFVDRGGDTERDWDGEYAGKWIDAAALIAANTGHGDLTTRLNAFTAALRDTQLPSGYMGISLTPGGNWDMWNMWYVLYATMTHYQNQGSDASLLTAERTGQYIVDDYLPPGNKYNILTGAWGGGCTVDVLDQLMRLHRLTGQTELKAGLMGLGDRISQNYSGVTEMRSSGTVRITHAYVVSAYLGGMVKYNQNRNNAADMGWIASVWQDVVNNHLFHTYSIGQGEQLRNPGSYALGVNIQETCATVEWMLYTERMWLATGDAKYMQQLENTIYNALLGAQSADGMGWMYHTRMDAATKNWFSGATRCCYWSGPRGIARMPQYAYHVDTDGLRVNLYEPNTATGIVVNGVPVNVTLDSNYPASGVITLTLAPAQPAAFALKLRLPDWAENISLSVNGASAGVPLIEGQYATVSRTWQSGDVVRLRFDQATTLVTRPAMPGISGAAVQRGPETLSLDKRDNPGLALTSVTLYADPLAIPTGTSPDGRRLYRMQALVGGSPDTVLLTPFADAGDSAEYRTVMPVSAMNTPVVLGDFNGDGVLSGLDIPGFKQALAMGRNAYFDQTGLDADALGDFNGDGVLSGLDIPGFKQALAGQ